MMNKLLALLLALCLPLCALPALAEEETEEVSMLTVLGTAAVTVDADYAQMTLGVVTSATAVEEAGEQNAAQIAAVVAALKASGVADADIVTEDYTVTPVYDYSYGKIGESQTVSGYQVQQLLRVTVRELAQVGALMDAGMKAGANETFGITFLSTQSAKAQDEALAAAVREAARRADVMAAACGHQVGGLVSLTESGAQDGRVTVAYAADKAVSGTVILPDSLTVTATVSATYRLK